MPTESAPTAAVNALLDETVVATASVVLLVMLGYGNGTVGIVVIGLMNVLDLATLLDGTDQ